MVSATEIIDIYETSIHGLVDKKFMDASFAHKCLIINQAKEIFFSAIAPYRSTNSTFKGMLQELEMIDIELSSDKKDDRSSFYLRPKDMSAFLGSVFVLASKGGKKKKILSSPIPNKSQHASLSDSFWKADFYFEQCFRTEDNKYIILNHDQEFDIEKAWASYLKQPNDMHCPELAPGGSYVYSDGKVYSKNIGLPFNKQAVLEIIEIATILSRDTGEQLNTDGIKKQLNLKYKN